MRIVCLPIDSRPCNTQFLRSISEWGGATCILPGHDSLDYFRQPASFESSYAFLLRELPSADAAVISLDHWCYGGLLASREAFIDGETTLHRIETLRDLLASYPGKPVYLSSVILRSSLSTLCSGDLVAYNAMTEYSVHMYRFLKSGNSEEEAAALNAATRIPPIVLERILEVRRRNLAVNLAAIDLAADGLCTTLSILQEDTQVDGLPRLDQEEIINRINQIDSKNVFLRNGTDEAGALSVGRALNENHSPVHANVVWYGYSGFTAPYEDRPFRENLDSACAEIGIVPDDSADTVIVICCPESDGEIKEHDSVPESYVEQLAGNINTLLDTRKRVYLLDVIRPNGGTFSLIQMLKHPESLWGYSAWNTASNSLGTLLAQLVSDHLHGAPNRPFLEERLLDDWLYQGHLRKRLDTILSESGDDIYSLSDKVLAETHLRNLYQETLPDFWPFGSLPDYRISLPWDRTFEVHAEVI